MAEGEGIDLGVEVDSLNDAQIDSEIGLIRADKDWQAGEGSQIGGNPRVGILQERLTKLYQKRHPEPEGRQDIPSASGLREIGDMARKEGFKTEEMIKAESQKAWDEIEAERMDRAREDAASKLRAEFGQESQQVINYAHYAVDRFLKKALTDEDWAELNKEMGNDPEFIKRLSGTIEYLDKKYWKGKARSYKREED